MGVDIAEVGRIQAAIERHGEVFLRRVYTANEREYCEQFKNRYERYAGRFAAKEAAMKALGTDRKSTRLNSSHGYISYAVFCLKKKRPSAPCAQRFWTSS